METLQAIYFGQKHPTFDYKAYEIMQKVKRLSKKHQRQCVNSCNGHGIVNGQMYYGGVIDDYVRRICGWNVKSSYTEDNEDYSIFDKEIDKIEEKINRIIKDTPFKVEYQRDPRGWTVWIVKLSYEDDFIAW